MNFPAIFCQSSRFTNEVVNFFGVVLLYADGLLQPSANSVGISRISCSETTIKMNSLQPQLYLDYQENYQESRSYQMLLEVWVVAGALEVDGKGIGSWGWRKQQLRTRERVLFLKNKKESKEWSSVGERNIAGNVQQC